MKYNIINCKNELILSTYNENEVLVLIGCKSREYIDYLLKGTIKRLNGYRLELA